ncbi:UNVERIFIED_CONTAM: hypothetical protein PYX00_009007 [Menopon gallinae]|uniref:Uncharacterized protein n=1 Tax=Menopon gallinae TaxID=328185 RepID=A0AAW2H9W8_9NEOP
MEGSYSYLDPNGELVNIHYIADENGFRPQGNIIHPAISSYLQNLQVESVKAPPAQPEESVRKV